MDCFAALAMTGRAHFHLPAARFARGFHIVSPKQEGAGNVGCLLHPRSRVQEMVSDAHTSIQVQPEHSGIPRAMVLRPGHRPPQKRFRSAGLYFPTRRTVLAYPKFSLVCGGQGVSQFSCTLLLVAALTLTACFGVAAWRISGGGDDVTGSTSSVSITSVENP